MAKRATGEPKPLDPDGHYGGEDVVVWSDSDLPTDREVRISEGLPVRETIYRIVRERGPVTLADLTRELLSLLPGAARPPYAQEPEAYVLRLVAGGRARLPSLASLDALIAAIAGGVEADPDYGLRLGQA
jgi:hypothetical protein